jgi:fucose permease
MSFAVDFGTSKGLGRHETDIPAAWDAPLLAAEYAAIVLYNPALMATKTSILLFYLSVARFTEKFLRIASYVTLAVVNVGGVVLTFITAFQCRPVQAAYNLAVENASCISIETIYLASAPVNIATDLAILVLPIPVLTGMRLPLRQKTILVLTFLLGVFVTIVDVVRIYYLQLAATSLDTLTSVGITTSLEFSYYASLALLWSAVEVNVGIICACIPTLRPLIKRLIPEMGSDHAHSSSGDKKGSPDSRNHNELRQPSSSTGLAAAAVDLQSVRTVQLAEDQGQQMRRKDFLTTRDMDPGVVLESAQPPAQQTEYSVYFGFVNMKRPKCMLDIRGSESVKYCALVITLIFLWGFSLGLLEGLNNEIPLVEIQNPYQLLSIPSAYFVGSVLGPLLLGQWVLRHHGFKATFVTSLGIFCIGTLMFYPSGALRSYPGLIVANVVVGVGISILEVASNSFITLCGPPQYAETRLLVAEGIGSIATLLSNLLSQRVFFVNVLVTGSLIVLQWTYLAIALFTVLLALFFYYMPLPEASDSDLQSQAERLGIDPSQKYFGRLPVIFATLTGAVLSLTFNAGAGESLVTFTTSLFSSVSIITATSQKLKTPDVFLVSAAVYVVSQFIFAFLCLLIPPRVLLLVAYTGSVTFSALIMALDLPSVNVAVSLVLVSSIFSAPIFPINFAIGLRGLGRWTKLAACLLTAGAGVGAIVFPFVMLAVLQARTVRYSFCVVVAVYAAGTLFPLYLNLFRAARHQVDPVALLTTTRPVGEDAEEIIQPHYPDPEVQLVGASSQY